MRPGRSAAAWRAALVALFVLLGCGPDGEGADAPAGAPGDVSAETSAPAEGPDAAGATAPGTDEPTVPGSLTGDGPRPATYAGPVLDLPPEAETDAPDPDARETERDWLIARGMVEWATGQGLGGLPTAEVAAIIGATFVGAPYEPGTLEVPGPEGLVINLRTFDCVTFVEHALVLARLVTGQAGEPEALLADEDAFRDTYRAELTHMRYRDGQVDGYPSRLHYFTEWLDHGIAAGELEEVTGELDGVVDDRPIHFMSSNPDAYRQLDEAPELVDEIRRIEERLTQGTRLYVPQERIAEVEGGIRNGDIIASVSTVEGLDIAHTGLALWHDDRLHLLHAPLVGDSVEVSQRPLAERIQNINAQKGIRVVRPR